VDESINNVEPSSAPMRINREKCKYSKKYRHVSCNNTPIERDHVYCGFIRISSIIVRSLKIVTIADYVGWFSTEKRIT